MSLLDNAEQLILSMSQQAGDPPVKMGDLQRRRMRENIAAIINVTLERAAARAEEGFHPHRSSNDIAQDIRAMKVEA